MLRRTSSRQASPSRRKTTTAPRPLFQPGQPMTAHWGLPDPAAVEGDEVTRIMAFRQTFRELENRIKIFVSLPLHSLDRLKLQKSLNEIGQVRLGDAKRADA